MRQDFGRGQATFTVGAGTGFTHPAGFLISDGTRQFRTLYPVVVDTGAGTFTVDIMATTLGMAGMAARSTITTMVDTPNARVTAVTNPSAVGNGRMIANTNGVTGFFNVPNGLLSNNPLGGIWDGSRCDF